jgi:hypothetical protein
MENWSKERFDGVQESVFSRVSSTGSLPCFSGSVIYIKQSLEAKEQAQIELKGRL